MSWLDGPSSSRHHVVVLRIVYADWGISRLCAVMESELFPTRSASDTEGGGRMFSLRGCNTFVTTFRSFIFSYLPHVGIWYDALAASQCLDPNEKATTASIRESRETWTRPTTSINGAESGKHTLRCPSRHRGFSLYRPHRRRMVNEWGRLGSPDKEDRFSGSVPKGGPMKELEWQYIHTYSKALMLTPIPRLTASCGTYPLGWNWALGNPTQQWGSAKNEWIAWIGFDHHETNKVSRLIRLQAFESLLPERAWQP